MIKHNLVLVLALTAACGDDDMPSATPLDPDTTPVVAVDRFSDAFANLFKRSAMPTLPAPNAPIDFDSGEPFITRGFSPDGNKIAYYNFDQLPEAPAPIFVLFKPGASAPVPDQLNIIDVIPGDAGYNDFWRVVKVTVPEDYVANTITSFDELVDAGYSRETTPDLVNCPVVPNGSTAKLRYTDEPTGLTRGWYKNQVVTYFNFSEAKLATVGEGTVPVADIYVTFTKNPDTNDPTSGPASGFLTEQGSMQTHNVPAVMPDDAGYSPLWSVDVYDNADFDSVSDLASARAATLLAGGAALVNCPIVSEEE
jgi:hypothetical protein